MPFIDAGSVSSRGLRVYYERQGAGPRLLYISGTGGDLRAKPGVFDSPLPAHFDVLAYDQRGLGQTAAPPGPYTMAQYAGDAAALLDEIGWERCAVMGVSFGGMVAQEFALRHPARIARLVLACTSSGGAGGASYPLHELSALAPEEHADRMLRLNDTRTAERSARNLERHASLVAALASATRSAPETAGGDEGKRLQLEARRHHDTWERLPSIAVPVLVCAGRYDGIAPLANSEALAARIPGARLEVFEGGHVFLAQDARAYHTITDFLLEDAG